MNKAVKLSLASESTEDTCAWVYVWNLNAKGVGHTAIQVGDTYMSIHPGAIPAVGPTTVLPLPATLASTLTEDKESEAQAERKNVADLDYFDPHAAIEIPPSQKWPDRSYRVPGLDTNAMRKAMRQVKAGVESGDVSYQLAPRIDSFGFFRELPAYISQDPVDIALARGKSMDCQQGKVYNCATLVSHILQTGGMKPPPLSLIPWEPTPNAIAKHLEKNGFRPV